MLVYARLSACINTTRKWQELTNIWLFHLNWLLPLIYVPGFVYQVLWYHWVDCVPVVRSFELIVSPALPSETQSLTGLQQ